MGDRLVMRWRWTFELFAVATRIGMPGVALGGFAFGLDGTARVAVGGAAIAMVAYALWTLRGGALVLDDVGIRSGGGGGGATARWDDVAAIRWSDAPTAHRPRPGLLLVGRDGRTGSALTPGLAADRIDRVDVWLRTNRPEIRIDPKPPWRDRFGNWHVAEPGRDPLETMVSIRRSLVGPWEIVARSCDGGFRAEQRVVTSGAVLTAGTVRETLADAKADGLRLVRDALVAAPDVPE